MMYGHQYHLPAGEYVGFNVMYTMTIVKVIFSGYSCFNFFFEKLVTFIQPIKINVQFITCKLLDSIQLQTSNSKSMEINSINFSYNRHVKNS